MVSSRTLAMIFGILLLACFLNAVRGCDNARRIDRLEDRLDAP